MQRGDTTMMGKICAGLGGTCYAVAVVAQTWAQDIGTLIASVVTAICGAILIGLPAYQKVQEVRRQERQKNDELRREQQRKDDALAAGSMRFTIEAQKAEIARLVARIGELGEIQKILGRDLDSWRDRALQGEAKSISPKSSETRCDP